MKNKKNNIAELILFLVVCIFTTLYLIFNYSKIELVQKFREESKQLNTNTHVIIKENNSIILDKYFSNNPIQTIKNQNVYFYDFDVNKYNLSKESVSIEQDGVTLTDFKLYKYNECTILETKNNVIHVFIPDNYVDKLSSMIPLFDKDSNINSKIEQSELIYQNSNVYDINYKEGDGDYTEERLNLDSSLLQDEMYILRLEYATTEQGNPFFITVDENLPGYYPIHQQLKPDTNDYTLTNMILIPEKSMFKPSLVLRNSGGKGSVSFKNVQIYKLKVQNMKDEKNN